MSRRGFRVVVAGLSFVAWLGTATAWAEEPPESPPPAFVAPPPGYEPPTSQGPTYVPTEPPPRSTGEILPTLMTLDRMDPTSRLGIQLGFDKLDAASLSDLFLMRFNPYGQYVFPGGMGGVYGQIPIARIFQSNQADDTGFGNLEMGGFFMPTRAPELIVRAGLALPTGSDSGDGVGGLIVSQTERITDLVLVAPNYTTLRLSASTLQEVGTIFFRGDVGFDLAIDKPNGGSRNFFRANFAVGVRLPPVDLAAELVNFGAIDANNGQSLEARFFHTIALGVRTQGVDQLHLGMVFPLDEALRGEIWILSLGYQRAFEM